MYALICAYACVYASAVIRYDLEFLGWCPCMVDVETIDKAGDFSTIVQCGTEACTCANKVRPAGRKRGQESACWNRCWQQTWATLLPGSLLESALKRLVKCTWCLLL